MSVHCTCSLIYALLIFLIILCSVAIQQSCGVLVWLVQPGLGVRLGHQLILYTASAAIILCRCLVFNFFFAE